MRRQHSTAARRPSGIRIGRGVASRACRTPNRPRPHPPSPEPAVHLMLTSERAELESHLGYAFRDPAWIELAMTHSSRHAETRKSGAPQSNEQLELLGDSVLGLVITDRLTAVYSNWSLGR